MAIKKSELYSSLWKSCDELRGGMDASQYKDYVLVLLFVKYVSDRYAGHKNALIKVPVGGSFADMIALKGSKAIGDQMNIIIGKLAVANNLSGVIDVADFNDEEKLGKGKEMVDRLSNLIAIFDRPELDFRSNYADGDDILGDAYEYLMRHFATESGKSKGQFYTPAEVSRIIAKVIGVDKATSSDQSIYDPTCGSGSLLLKAHDVARIRTGLDLAVFGQEMDNATFALARMNMILHDCTNAEIRKNNTLSCPQFKQSNGDLQTFDFVVANPPFSTKAWSNGFDPMSDDYGRFVYGFPPAKNGDYAFLLHVLTSLKSNGKGAVILPHGVLFRGGAEGIIRKRIIKQGYIKGVIGLPANLFYGTSIPACILVLDKEGSRTRDTVFMIDASKAFIKDGNKNRLRAQDIHKIVDSFNRQVEITKYSRLVSLAEIEANDYNLNIPRYIDSSEIEDLQDISAHLLGGIPNRDIDNLAHFWRVFPGLRAVLFSAGNRPGYSQLRISSDEIKPCIFDQDEFAAFKGAIHVLFVRWKEANFSLLKDIAIGDSPKQLIELLSKNLLMIFQHVELVDPYDVYQSLMTYWTDTMQDDVYMVIREGWRKANKVRLLNENGKRREKADIEIGKQKFKTDLIPPSLLIARYFFEEQTDIEQLTLDIEKIAHELEDLKEEHCGEEGLLCEVLSDKGTFIKKNVITYLKRLHSDNETGEEYKLVQRVQELLERGVELNNRLKQLQMALNTNILRKYEVLDDDQIAEIVINDKWLAMLERDFMGQLDHMTQGLANRIRELAERYAFPLPIIQQDLVHCNTKVEGHLKLMGHHL